MSNQQVQELILAQAATAPAQDPQAVPPAQEVQSVSPAQAPQTETPAQVQAPQTGEPTQPQLQQPGAADQTPLSAQDLPSRAQTPASDAPAILPDQAVQAPAPAAEAAPAPDGGFLDFSPFEGLSALVDLGGPVVALLLVLSVFALTILLIKLWQFAKLARGTRRRIPNAIRLWLAGDHAAALKAIGEVPGPVASVVGQAMLSLARQRPDSVVREQTEHRAATLLAGMRSYLRALESVVQVAPLLGLFGTVIGMIEAFQALEAAGTQVEPGDLAGGIWVALLTTAVGLAIAMPVALVLYWLEGRIERFGRQLEGWLTDVLTHPPAGAVKLSREQAAAIAATAPVEVANAS